MKLHYRLLNPKTGVVHSPEVFDTVEAAEAAAVKLDPMPHYCITQAYNEQDEPVHYQWRERGRRSLRPEDRGVTLKTALAYQRVWILNVMRGQATSDETPLVDVVERVGKQQRVVRTYHRALKELVKELGL